MELNRVTELGKLLEAAVLKTLHDYGHDHGLMPLAWALIAYPEGNVVEGHPLSESHIGVCEEWAATLGMTEYRFDTGDGVRSWHLDDGSFHVELTTEVAG